MRKIDVGIQGSANPKNMTIRQPTYLRLLYDDAMAANYVRVAPGVDD